MKNLIDNNTSFTIHDDIILTVNFSWTTKIEYFTF